MENKIDGCFFCHIKKIYFHGNLVINVCVFLFVFAGGGNSDGELRGSRSGRSARREDPRRHTLSGDQHMYNQGGAPGGILRTMDLEVRNLL